jgi:hypothetical protein
MTSLSNELHDSILGHLAKGGKLLGSPTMWRKSRKKYNIHSGNYFFKESKNIPLTLNEISQVIENTIKVHIGSNGELIKGVIRAGDIWDSGKSYFEIKGGSYFEVYCFSCKSLTLVRVTHEKTLYPPEKEWLSIDMDEDQDTIWLEEPCGGSSSSFT